MTRELLEQLQTITKEEQNILDGHQEIDTDIYMNEQSNMVDCKKLLDAGKLIQVRTHTRFIHFPAHTHNYIELVYMCSGTTHHVINEEDLLLKEGELLFLNQKATQEIFPAGEKDIAINFIILPEFFDYALKMTGEEENLVRDFILDSLRSDDNRLDYLHFQVSEILPVQNLMENLIWTIKNSQPNKRSINQVTMGLLLLQLMNYTDRVVIGKDNIDQDIILSVYRYIEENYKAGELSWLAENLHYDLYWLSRLIRKMTGRTYTELVQAKRLSQATFLLSHTGLRVSEIGNAVGYDNLSYFYRIFQDKYKVSPKKYRDENKEQ